jgi:uncharacterized membrane protein YesL
MAFTIMRPSQLLEKTQSLLCSPKTKDDFKRIDAIGTSFLLAASILLVTTLKEATLGRAVSSGLIIAFLVVLVCLWILFILLEWRNTLAARLQEPIFPWRFLRLHMRFGMVMFVILPFEFTADTH